MEKEGAEIAETTLGLVVQGFMKADTCSLKCPLRGLLSPNLEQGVESIDQIASLCQSDVEAVRVAARETTLSFGEVQRAALPNVGRGWEVPGSMERLCWGGHGQLPKDTNPHAGQAPPATRFTTLGRGKFPLRLRWQEALC